METGADCLAVGTAGAPERMMEMNYVLYCFFQIVELLIHTGSFIWFLYSMPREEGSKPWVRYCIWGIFMILTFLLPALWWNDIITMSVLTAYYIAVCWLLSQEQNLDPVFSDLWNGKLRSSGNRYLLYRIYQ